MITFFAKPKNKKTEVDKERYARKTTSGRRRGGGSQLIDLVGFQGRRKKCRRTVLRIWDRKAMKKLLLWTHVNPCVDAVNGVGQQLLGGL